MDTNSRRSEEPVRRRGQILKSASRRLLRRRTGRRGMTLVEVMVVIAIILTLMSVLAVGVFGVFRDSQVDTTILTMSRVNQKVEIYMLRKKKVPSDLGPVFGDEDIPVDSWGNEFRLVSPGPGAMKYDIISLGADGADGGTGNNADIKWSENK